MTVFEYSSNYFPAAPICEVYLGSGGQEPTVGPLIALIDTGADLTVVPLIYLQQVKAPRVSQGRVRSIGTASRLVDIYAVSLKLNGFKLLALQVLADSYESEIVLGRTVLNRFKLILDGPAAMTEFVNHV
jgi:predicted aspartyl protease